MLEFGEKKVALGCNKPKEQNKDVFCAKLRVPVDSFCCLLA